MSDYNVSPWIEQLKGTVPISPLQNHTKTDIVIVGGGISGITTAYFILKNTDKTVTLLESDKIAHGASGHNAGQIVSYFERSTTDLIQEFGGTLTAKAKYDIYTSWELLYAIANDAKISTPITQFTGYSGCTEITNVISHLENVIFCQKENIPHIPVASIDDKNVLRQIPKKYAGLYAVMPRKEILSKLETTDTRYIALLSEKKGVMNTAVFCEELATYLLSKYTHRFNLHQKSPVQEICLEKNKVLLSIDEYVVTAKKIVLCTNGFTSFTIKNSTGGDINAKFHQSILSIIGYMAGYKEKVIRPPIAISYASTPHTEKFNRFNPDPYIYLTRRKVQSGNAEESLLCIGGPETIPDGIYSNGSTYPKKTLKIITDFLKKSYRFSPRENLSYSNTWHGLMGYTTNGVRLIGPEPLNPLLLYNLGCNGVGILPSIYGSKRIAQYLSNKIPEPSIFDPK